MFQPEKPKLSTRFHAFCRRTLTGILAVFTLSSLGSCFGNRRSQIVPEPSNGDDISATPNAFVCGCSTEHGVACQCRGRRAETSSSSPPWASSQKKSTGRNRKTRSRSKKSRGNTKEVQDLKTLNTDYPQECKSKTSRQASEPSVSTKRCSPVAKSPEKQKKSACVQSRKSDRSSSSTSTCKSPNQERDVSSDARATAGASPGRCLSPAASTCFPHNGRSLSSVVTVSNTSVSETRSLSSASNSERHTGNFENPNSSASCQSLPASSSGESEVSLPVSPTYVTTPSPRYTTNSADSTRAITPDSPPNMDSVEFDYDEYVIESDDLIVQDIEDEDLW